MALTTEEKIKILYEDSLKDIRDLTARIEGVKESQGTFETAVKTLMSSIPALANKEMKRASSEVISTLSENVGRIAQQVAGNAAVAKKTTFVLFGLLAGLAMFGFGVSYGAVYSTWSNPLWINRTGLLSVLSSALLKAPTGGVGCILIALNLFFLQKNLTDLMAGNEADEPVLKILVYLFAAVFAGMGLWLNFLVIV